MVVTEAIKEAIWLYGLVEDLGIYQEHVIVFCDSQRTIYLAKNQVHHSWTKHIDVRFHFVREIIDEGDILHDDEVFNINIMYSITNVKSNDS